MDTATFAAAFAAIRSAQDSDEPESKRTAARLASELKTNISDFTEWVNDFADTVGALTDRADELADADADDRPGCHGDFVAAAEAVVEALLDLGLTEDAIMQHAPVTA